ncbi:hypothetical protein AHAS_Ahas16G0139900 [Arachis hypogaea]
MMYTLGSDGTIKLARLSMREAMERPNGRKIVLRFNNAKQAIGNEVGLLSGVLGLLGSNFGKFPICEESWRKITTKDKVYNECVKQIFHIDEDSEGTIKKYLEKYGKVLEGDKAESEQQGRIVGRGELWIAVHKKKDGSYMNDEARAIGERIEEIEQHDESSRVLSQNDSIAQVFGKEKPGRVRGVGFGPTPSQLFGPNSHGPGNGVQLEETQRKLLELEAQLEGEKLKRKAMEDEAAADKKKMKAMESALIYLFQRQGEELPPDIAAGMRFVE